MVSERTFTGPLAEAAPAVSPPWTEEESLELALNGINGFEGTKIITAFIDALMPQYGTLSHHLTHRLTPL